MIYGRYYEFLIRRASLSVTVLIKEVLHFVNISFGGDDFGRS